MSFVSKPLRKCRSKLTRIFQNNVQPYVTRCASSSLNSNFAEILTPKPLVRFFSKILHRMYNYISTARLKKSSIRSDSLVFLYKSTSNFLRVHRTLHDLNILSQISCTATLFHVLLYICFYLRLEISCFLTYFLRFSNFLDSFYF